MMVLPSLKAVLLKPYSNLQKEEKDPTENGFLDFETPNVVNKTRSMHGVYQVLSCRGDQVGEYDIHIGDIVLVEEAAVNNFDWKGEKYYFVNSPQYIPLVLVR